MPAYWTYNDERELVQRYDWPANRFEWSAKMFDAVAAVRREASQVLGLVAAVKDLKRDQLRTQRACGFVLDLAGAFGPMKTDLWPIELASEFDRLASVMENAADGR